MPQQCSICTSPDRAKIDRELATGTGTIRDIAGQWSVSKTALHRHKAEGHVSQRIAKSAAGRELMESESLADHITTLRRRADVLYSDACELLEKAKAGDDVRATIAAVNATRSCIGESRELLRLCGEMAGQLAPQGASLTVIAPILVASFDCIPDPEARAAAKIAVARRLQELDSTLQLPPAGT